MLRLPFFLAVACASAYSASATCYMFNGTKMTDPSYQPCVQTEGVFSMCCGTNHSSSVVANDVCLATGLCQNWDTFDDGNTVVMLWRGSCTDPTWNSPNCLKNVCYSTSDNIGNSPVTNCTDGTYCCGADETGTCCQLSTGKFRLAATIGVTSSTTSTTSSTSSATSTTAPPSTTSLSATSAASSPVSTGGGGSGGGLSTSAKIGIGVGVPAGVLLAIGAGILLWLSLNKKAKGHELEAKETWAWRRSDKMNSSVMARNLHPVEADGTPRAEMMG